MSDARGFSPRWIIAILFCFNLFTQYLHAANIVGTVIDENTGFGIEGVTVTLDLDPVGGLPDATATTGPFGYYRIEEIVSGPGFTLTASHPAYDNESKTEGTLVADESRVLSFALNRSNEGVTILDIQVSVRAVNSGNLLANVPIHAWRFSTSDGSDPADFRTVRTDNNGNADFRGFEAGFFQFS